MNLEQIVKNVIRTNYGLAEENDGPAYVIIKHDGQTIEILLKVQPQVKGTIDVSIDEAVEVSDEIILELQERGMGTYDLGYTHKCGFSLYRGGA